MSKINYDKPGTKRTSMVLENSYEIMYASEEEEFFYEDTNEPVQEGDPIGVEFTVFHSNEELDWIHEQQWIDSENEGMALKPTKEHQEQVWPMQKELETRYKDLLEDDSVLKEVKFVLDKGIYWYPDASLHILQSEVFPDPNFPDPCEIEKIVNRTGFRRRNRPEPWHDALLECEPF